MGCSNEKTKKLVLTLQLPWLNPTNSPYATITTHFFGNGSFENWGARSFLLAPIKAMHPINSTAYPKVEYLFT